MSTSKIVNLAQAILAGVQQLDGRLQSKNWPALSVGIEANTADHVCQDDPQAQMAKEMVIGAAKELTTLLEGPVRRIQNIAASEYDIAVLHVIHRFQLAHAFELGKTASFQDISAWTSGKLSPDQVRRVLRYAMTNGVFVEPSPGLVGHTALSRALVQDPNVIAEAGQLTDEQFGACAHFVQAIDTWGESSEPTQTGWSLANQATLPMYNELQAKHERRAKQFGRFMDIWAVQHPVEPIVEDFKANGLTREGLHVVDVGGGKGHISIALAKALPGLHFTVQDVMTAQQDVSAVPDEVRDRVAFSSHDFFASEQPIKGADVYFLRSVFHNWSDKYCVQLLKNFIPALKPGARIILNDLCMTENRFAPPIERMTRGLDLVMMSLFNGKERSESEFANIFSSADKRFKFVGAREPAVNEVGIPYKGIFSMIEAVWQP